MLSQKHGLCNAASCRSFRRQYVPISRRQHVQVWAQNIRVPAREAAQYVDDGYTYADVRTPQEFAAGRPKGSINIPFMLSTPEGMQPNPEFLQVWKETFPDTAADIVVGCKSGNRSARACALLAQENYSNLVDNADGYDGWAADGLPAEK